MNIDKINNNRSNEFHYSENERVSRNDESGSESPRSVFDFPSKDANRIGNNATSVFPNHGEILYENGVTEGVENRFFPGNQEVTKEKALHSIRTPLSEVITSNNANSYRTESAKIIFSSLYSFLITKTCSLFSFFMSMPNRIFEKISSFFHDRNDLPVLREKVEGDWAKLINDESAGFGDGFRNAINHFMKSKSAHLFNPSNVSSGSVIDGEARDETVDLNKKDVWFDLNGGRSELLSAMAIDDGIIDGLNTLALDELNGTSVDYYTFLTEKIPNISETQFMKDINRIGSYFRFRGYKDEKWNNFNSVILQGEESESMVKSKFFNELMKTFLATYPANTDDGRKTQKKALRSLLGFSYQQGMMPSLLMNEAIYEDICSPRAKAKFNNKGGLNLIISPQGEEVMKENFRLFLTFNPDGSVSFETLTAYDVKKKYDKMQEDMQSPYLVSDFCQVDEGAATEKEKRQFEKNAETNAIMGHFKATYSVQFDDDNDTLNKFINANNEDGVKESILQDFVNKACEVRNVEDEIFYLNKI